MRLGNVKPAVKIAKNVKILQDDAHFVISIQPWMIPQVLATVRLVIVFYPFHRQARFRSHSSTWISNQNSPISYHPTSSTAQLSSTSPQ
jgi:hypothetical protein